MTPSTSLCTGDGEGEGGDQSPRGSGLTTVSWSPGVGALPAEAQPGVRGAFPTEGCLCQGLATRGSPLWASSTGMETSLAGGPQPAGCSPVVSRPLRRMTRVPEQTGLVRKGADPRQSHLLPFKNRHFKNSTF